MPELATAPVTAPAAPPPVVVAPAAPTPAAKSVPTGITSDVLKQRLDESRNAGQTAALKAMGFADQAEADAYLKTKREQDDANKTEAEKTAARIATLEGQTARTAQLEALVASHATAALEALPEKTRVAIEESATTPEEQLRLIGIMQRAGTIEAPTVADPATVAAAIVAPATTTPPATAPADSPTSPPDHRKIWEGLTTTNPVQAAHYLARHTRAVFPE